jgi:diaminopimelate decarboxylase
MKDGEIYYVVLDVGINVADCVRDEYHEIFPLKINTQGKHSDSPLAKPCRFVGPICHLGDALYGCRWMIPPKVGDRFAICDSGAYFVPMGNRFSFPQPGIIMVEANSGETIVSEIRQAEEFNDLVSLDQF